MVHARKIVNEYIFDIDGFIDNPIAGRILQVVDMKNRSEIERYDYETSYICSHLNSSDDNSDTTRVTQTPEQGKVILVQTAGHDPYYSLDRIECFTAIQSNFGHCEIYMIYKITSNNLNI